MFALLKSMQAHYEIRSTFDGEMADLEVRRPPGRVETLLDAWDFVYEAYQNTRRERLLEFMAGAMFAERAASKR